MADKTIKVKVDVETDVEPSIAALKALKKQLKDTAAGSADFQRLQQQINDTEDALKAARTGAGNFTEILGQLPGPIGDVGNKVSGAVNVLKQFGSLKLTDIKTSFTELGKDIVDAAVGLGRLTGITKLYTTVNGALAKSFIAIGVGEGIAAAGARALAAALIATGIGALVVLLGTAASMLYELATGEKEAAAAAKQLNDAIESQNRLLDANAKSAANRRKVTIAQMKAAGKDEKEIRDFQIKNAYKDYESAYAAEQEARKIYNQNIAKADGEGSKKLAENLNKRIQETKDYYASYLELGYNNVADQNKAEQTANQQALSKSQQKSQQLLAQRQRELDEAKKIKQQELEVIQKGDEDAFKSTLSAREKEEYEINSKYVALEGLAIKHKKDTTILETGRLAELAAIKKKYDDEAAEKQKEIDEKKKEKILKQQEDERGILLTELQTKFEALDRENAKVDGDFVQDLERFKQQREILASEEAIELQNTELTEFQKTEIRKKYGDARIALSDKEIATEKAAMEAKHAINMAYLGLFEQFGNVLTQIAGKNKGLAIAGVVISQAAAIGQIVAQTAIANAKSVAASPLTGGMPWVAINTISAGLSIASTIASAVKSIQQINSADSQSSSTASVSGGGAALPNISAPTVAATPTPQIQTQGGQNPTTQLSETIGGAMKPVRAYVVSQDIQSQSALDRRTNRAATFSSS